MRNCDNCIHGSYGMDCNSGIESLYCCESIYEYQVNPNDLCESHQFIDGMEDEKNFVLYDKSYLGEGCFIIHTKNGSINKFLKLYFMNNEGYPNYCLRAFDIDGKDNPEDEFNRIEFIFRSNEDFDSGLFDVFSIFSRGICKEIYTIDEHQQGRNNISMCVDNGIIKLIISKDIWRGKQHPSDFIDINFGDNYSCQNYEEINALYNRLIEICPKIALNEDIKRLMKLKIK